MLSFSKSDFKKPAAKFISCSVHSSKRFQQQFCFHIFSRSFYTRLLRYHLICLRPVPALSNQRNGMHLGFFRLPIHSNKCEMLQCPKQAIIVFFSVFLPSSLIVFNIYRFYRRIASAPVEIVFTASLIVVSSNFCFKC